VLGVGRHKDWSAIARIEAVPDLPNVVTISATRSTVELIGLSPEISGVVSKVRLGSANVDGFHDSIAVLHLGDGTNRAGLPAVQVLEVQLSDGATTVEDAVIAWPPPDMDVE
jgi:hypothetical protein